MTENIEDKYVEKNESMKGKISLNTIGNKGRNKEDYMRQRRKREKKMEEVIQKI